MLILSTIAIAKIDGAIFVGRIRRLAQSQAN